MCGFTGIWYAHSDRKIDLEILQEMIRVITHRGPDDGGYHISGNLGLGFRRLSIIDLEAGHQPMCDLHERAWIVFNGEIYNYRQLRFELEALGYKFRTNSDTEVIINAYLEYDEAFVNRLRGMFAFAIWDKKNNKIILGRDRFGVKPLYYALNNNRIVFGSEMKCILKGKFSEKEIDWQAVDSYFSYGYILNPLSIYKDIRKLQPGHLLIIETNGSKLTCKLKKYWQPVFEEDNSINFEDYKEKIREKLKESVKAHLVSDVPVGAFLSGGIDSNAVVSTMAKISPEQVKTFSIGFKESGFNEAILAKKSAAQYGTDHTELYLEPESPSIIESIIDMYDEPFADSSAIPTYFVSKLASQSVKAVLSGDGGDELFGGYDTYRRLLKMQNLRCPIRLGRPVFSLLSRIIPPEVKGKRFLHTLTKDPSKAYAYFMDIWEKEKHSFYHPEIFDLVRQNPAVEIKLNYLIKSKSPDFISRMMELDISSYMVDDILTKVDRSSMANSLEVRVPIIDHEFFELASRIPSSMKIKGQTGKYIFREAMKAQIPDFIYSHPKRGFTAPINKWFKGDWSQFSAQMLDEAKSSNIISPKYINNLLQKENSGSLITRIWPIIVLTSWLRNIHTK